MDRYLNGEDIDPTVLIDDLEKATSKGTFYPVLPVSALTGAGLTELLDGIVAACPTPGERRCRGDHPRRQTRPEDQRRPERPAVAEVVRTSIDAYVGRVSLVRVFSGTLRPDRPIHVAGHGMADRGHEDHDADERVAHLQSPLGSTLRRSRTASPATCARWTKVASAETGDTVSDAENPLLMQPWRMPEPLLPVAVVAKTAATRTPW